MGNNIDFRLTCRPLACLNDMTVEVSRNPRSLLVLSTMSFTIVGVNIYQLVRCDIALLWSKEDLNLTCNWYLTY